MFAISLQKFKYFNTKNRNPKKRAEQSEQGEPANETEGNIARTTPAASTTRRSCLNQHDDAKHSADGLFRLKMGWKAGILDVPPLARDVSLDSPAKKGRNTEIRISEQIYDGVTPAPHPPHPPHLPSLAVVVTGLLLILFL